MGGGTELALACRWRIVSDSPSTKIGLPEVMLGIFPGFGGTVRLPRVVGLRNALLMILTGKTISGRKAHQFRFADRCFFAKDFMQKTESFARTISVQRTKVKKENFRFIRKFPIRFFDMIFGNMILAFSRRSVLKKTFGLYPAPLSAIEVIRSTYLNHDKNPFLTERKAFAKLAVSHAVKNMTELFFRTERIKKCSALMINEAMFNNHTPYRVHLAGKCSTRKAIEKIFLKNKIALVKNNSVFADCVLLTGKSTDWNKEKILSAAKYLSPDGIILVSTYPLLNLSDYNADLAGRSIGFRIVRPLLSPIAEIIPFRETDRSVVKTAMSIARKTRLLPIIEKTGSLTLCDSVFSAILDDADTLLANGLSKKEINRATALCGLIPGIFRITKTIGNSEAAALLSAYRRERSDIKFDEPLSLKVGDIAERIAKRIINESQYCYANSFLSEKEMIDTILVLAGLYPPYKGGPFTETRD